MLLGMGLAYVFGSQCFIQHPGNMARGLWMLTHVSVLTSGCPRCQARAGEPCRNISSGNILTRTHFHRRLAHQRLPDAKISAIVQLAAPPPQRKG